MRFPYNQYTLQHLLLDSMYRIGHIDLYSRVPRILRGRKMLLYIHRLLRCFRLPMWIQIADILGIGIPLSFHGFGSRRHMPHIRNLRDRCIRYSEGRTLVPERCLDRFHQDSS